MRFLTVDDRGDGQRLDNYVLRECGSVPKTRLYRAMRKGEIRVNKGRAKPDTRLKTGDMIRLPPLTVRQGQSASAAPHDWQQRLAQSVIYEDDVILALNKPSGIAVHGGSGLQFGLIETLRAMRPEHKFLELVHRLDRETSGLILIAKRASALRALHDLLRRPGGIDKRYLALVAGRWPRHLRSVDAPLLKYERASGERHVRVARDGKPSLTEFSVQKAFADCTLVEARPKTGRTHQIRVHATHAGHPLLGDEKYFDNESLRLGKTLRMRRVFLHAAYLRFRLNDKNYELTAPMSAELDALLAALT